MEKEAAFSFFIDWGVPIESLAAKLDALTAENDAEVPQERWVLRTLPSYPPHMRFLTWDGAPPEARHARLSIQLASSRDILVKMSAPDRLDEAWQRQLAEVRDRLLPSLGATKIKPAPVRQLDRAYWFQPGMTWKQVVAKLDVRSNWIGKTDNRGRWLMRDNDRRGEYLTRFADQDGDANFPTSTAIYWDATWHMTMWMGALVPEWETARQNYERYVFEELMPSIGASDLKPSDFER
jgi:hypothetical protein